MACLKPDGKPTHAGLSLLRALADGARKPEEVSTKARLPLFRVRSGLRELHEAGYVVRQDYQTYALSPRGRALLAEAAP